LARNGQFEFFMLQRGTRLLDGSQRPLILFVGFGNAMVALVEFR